MNSLPNSLINAHLDINQQVIAAYADLTSDYNPIHLDQEFAAKTPMGGVIAHGTMSIGLIWQALEKTLGSDCLSNIDLDIRFIKPVRLGDRLIGGGNLQDAQTGTYEVWVRGENDGENRIVGTAAIQHA